MSLNSEANHPASRSYRFNAKDQSVFYTGDTGPSKDVKKLCRNKGMLVSESMDTVSLMRRARSSRSDMSDAVLNAAEAHFRKEHLSPDETGLPADGCGAGMRVLVNNGLRHNEIPAAREIIGRHYKGKIVFAEDLQSVVAPVGALDRH
jgi:ribonuclease BN (tRNA processing enzyme)